MSTEYFDLVIVGAGLSGIGAGVHFENRCAGKSYVILEAREQMGGTWDLFRYPGIRSDSDMHTLGYNFKPWKGAKAIADGPSILRYIQETAREYRINEKVRYQHRLEKAMWCSKKGRWELLMAGEDEVRLSCGILYMCAGYYSYERAHSPDFPGRERFEGDIIHPQMWPRDYDYAGKRVVVIGSGATAVTLVPAMADEAENVTMLQRSPSYVVAWPAQDKVANFLRAILPAKLAYGITRWKNTHRQQYLYNLTQTQPKVARAELLRRARKALGPDYDIDTHFTPRYNPWEQRVCLAPDGDIFDAIREGKARVVTDHIESFTETGIALKSGAHLDADLIITATGLELVAMGQAQFEVDGALVRFSETWSYKGIASSDVPNLFGCFGYLNASWTLRADLISQFVCRVVNHLDAVGMRQVTARLRESDRDMEPRNWVEGFSSGYLMRTMHLFPKQGDRMPWINPQNYHKDRSMYLAESLQDGVLQFSSPVGLLEEGDGELSPV